MRMVAAPIGLRVQKFEELSGPTLLGSSSSNTSFIQNVVDPFGLWSFQVDFPPIKGGMARAFEKWRTSLLAGANCTRLTMCSQHEPTYAELGINLENYPQATVPWSNGLPWSNGEPWSLGKPICNIAAASDLDSSIITVDLTNWNGVVPAWFGIVGHFAVYKVIGEDLTDTTAARLKVWPPVRKAITTADYATLRPVIAVTLSNGGVSASGYDQNRFLNGASLTVREVLQETVENYVTEGF